MKALVYNLDDYRRIPSKALEQAHSKTREQLVDEFCRSLLEQETIERDIAEHHARIRRDFGDIA